VSTSGKQLNKLHKLGAAHALYRKNGKWYHALVRFPGVLCDNEGYVTFESERAYLKCEGIKHGPDPKTIHVRDGINSLSGYRRF
jgi:5-methylcytosine-specific restriction enzyme A